MRNDQASEREGEGERESKSNGKRKIKRQKLHKEFTLKNAFISLARRRRRLSFYLQKEECLNCFSLSLSFTRAFSRLFCTRAIVMSSY
jgi:hypothetical protein